MGIILSYERFTLYLKANLENSKDLKMIMDSDRAAAEERLEQAGYDSAMDK